MSNFKWWKPTTWFHAQVDDAGGWSLWDAFGRNTKSDIRVDANSALSIPVVWSCISVIADSASGLPLKVYDQKENNTRTTTDSKTHDVRRINRPNTYVSMADLIKFITTNMCLSGNAFALIERNSSNDPIRFIPVHYSRVRVVVNDSGFLGYEVSIHDSAPTPVSYENMLHFKIHSLDGLIGLNPITYLAETLGLSLAARDWASSFMKSGGWSGGYIVYDQFLDADQRAKIKKDLPDIRRGRSDVGNMGLLQGGPKIYPAGISPKDSQFIEAQRNQDEVISGAYKVPLWMINRMGSGSYVGNGLEQQILSFLVFGLDPYLKVIETELNYKLWGITGRHDRFVEFTRQAMMQMDSAARGEYYSKALGGPGRQGYMSVNQVRELENQPLLDGDEYNKVVIWENKDAGVENEFNT